MTDDWRTAWTPQPHRDAAPRTPAEPRTAPQGGTAYGRATLERLAGDLAATGEGGRNGGLNWAAYRCGQLIAGGEMDEQDARAAITQAARAAGLDDAEIAKTLESGITSGLLEPRSAPPRADTTTGEIWPSTSTSGPTPEPRSAPPPGGSPAGAASGSATAGANAGPTSPPSAPETGTEPPERTSWWPRDLDAALDGRDEEPPPAMLARADGQHLLYAGKVNGIIGESESGKTWIALLAATQALKDGRRVLYLDFEDSAPGIVSRLKAAGASRGELAALTYTGPDESLHHAAAEDLRETLDTLRPDLVVVDGFNAAMQLLGLEINSNNDATAFSQKLLKPIARTGAVVLYVDHVPKNSEARGKGGIGAQAKRAMTTGCAIGVEVVAPFGRGMTGQLRLTVDKDRPGHVRAASLGGRRIGTAWLESDPAFGTVTMRIENARDEWTAEQDAARESLTQEVTRLLASHGHMTQRQLCDYIKGRAQDTRATLADMASDGLLIVEDGPKRSLVYRLANPDPVRPDAHGTHWDAHTPLRGSSASVRPDPRRDAQDALGPVRPADQPHLSVVEGDEELRWDQR